MTERGHHRTAPVADFERRVAVAAIVTSAALSAVGIASAVVWPEIVSETNETGADAWPGALFGLTMIVIVVALPQLLFGLALRSGRRGPLRATLVGAPVWAVYVGLMPIVSALIGGWEGLIPLMVISAAAAAVVDVFVTVAARRALRRPPGDAPVVHAG